MSQLNMIVKIKAKEDTLEQLKAAALKAVAATREESGCITYTFHQDLKEPTTLFVYEVYADKGAFKAHATSAHMAEYIETTKGMAESVEMHKVAPLS